MKKVVCPIWKNIIYFLLLLPFVQPPLFSEYEQLHSFFIILKIISFCIVGILYLLKFIRKEIKINKFICLVVLYLIFLSLSTYLNEASIIRCLSYVIPIISITMILDIWISYDMKICLRFISNLLSIFIIINFFSLFILKDIYFLGSDNRFIFTMLPTLISLGFYDYIFNKHIGLKTYFIYFICLLSLVIRWSVAAMIGVFMIGLFLLLYNKKLKKMNIKRWYIPIIVLYIIILIPITQSFLLDICSLLFHKRQTIESRFMLWNWAIEYIKNKPLLGYGIENLSVLSSKFLVVHCHNMFLQFMYECGIFGVLIYFNLFHVTTKRNDQNHDVKISNLSNIFIFITLLLGIFDTYNHSFIFMMMFIIFKINSISKEVEYD